MRQAKHPSLRLLRLLSDEQVAILMDGESLEYCGARLRIDTSQLAKLYAYAHGYYGQHGGWIYKDDRVICQGWWEFHRRYRHQINEWVWRHIRGKA